MRLIEILLSLSDLGNRNKKEIFLAKRKITKGLMQVFAV